MAYDKPLSALCFHRVDDPAEQRQLLFRIVAAVRIRLVRHGKMGEDALRPQTRQGAGRTAVPVSKCLPETRYPNRDIPVSTLMCTVSSPPQRTASSLYSSALAWQDTAWVMCRSMSRPTCSRGVWPRIRMGMVMPLHRSSAASSMLDTAR